jgi:hypothetical protein
VITSRRCVGKRVHQNPKNVPPIPSGVNHPRQPIIRQVWFDGPPVAMKSGGMWNPIPGDVVMKFIFVQPLPIASRKSFAWLKIGIHPNMRSNHKYTYYPHAVTAAV